MPLSSSLGGERFSRQTLSALEPVLHTLIKDTLGFSEVNLLQNSITCIQQGGGAEDIKQRLSSILDGRKATKLANKIVSAVDDFCVSHDLPTRGDGPKKRLLDHGNGPEPAGNADVPRAKAPRTDEGPTAPIPNAPISSDQIRQMMANARKEIESRLQQLGSMTSDAPMNATMAASAPTLGPQQPIPPDQPQPPPTNLTGDKTRALAELQAQIAARISKMGDKLPAAPAAPDRPTPVILNSMGRTVDASGQEIQLAHHVPTLKANLRAKRRDEMKEHLKDVPSQAAAVQESKFFDTRVGAKAAHRTKRSFKFNEPGKFQMEGQRMRMKAQLDRLQADISTIARKTGIASATQLAKLVPKDAQKGKIPDAEWWDNHILSSDGGYDDLSLREGAITNLIEHPIQMMPLEPNKPVHVPVFLTKKEQKKLRRQNRREAWKEKQDKIRLGLLPPDEPKVKMSNLMRVLGTEAVQDPTKVEAHVREQMAKRLASHEKANAERKLTPEQKRDKMINKIKEDTSCGVNVAVYRVKSLSNPSKRFKVETNAKQLFMTGSVVLYEDVNVVVVEGGPKQQKKYKQLMLNRIKWDDETYQDKDGTEMDNGCILVWEGQTKERNFGEMRMKQCPTESFARDYFKKHGVEHYWDQAYSGAVLEATEIV